MVNRIGEQLSSGGSNRVAALALAALSTLGGCADESVDRDGRITQVEVVTQGVLRGVHNVTCDFNVAYPHDHITFGFDSEGNSFEALSPGLARLVSPVDQEVINPEIALINERGGNMAQQDLLASPSLIVNGLMPGSFEENNRITFRGDPVLTGFLIETLGNNREIFSVGVSSNGVYFRNDTNTALINQNEGGYAVSRVFPYPARNLHGIGEITINRPEGSSVYLTLMITSDHEPLFFAAGSNTPLTIQTLADTFDLPTLQAIARTNGVLAPNTLINNDGIMYVIDCHAPPPRHLGDTGIDFALQPDADHVPDGAGIDAGDAGPPEDAELPGDEGLNPDSHVDSDTTDTQVLPNDGGDEGDEDAAADSARDDTGQPDATDGNPAITPDDGDGNPQGDGPIKTPPVDANGSNNPPVQKEDPGNGADGAGGCGVAPGEKPKGPWEFMMAAFVALGARFRRNQNNQK